MTRQKNDILQGTLALLVLKTLAEGGPDARVRHHRPIQRVSAELLRVEEGSLYPALHRMTQDGWLRAEWGVTEKNRQARFYTITRAGRKQLVARGGELGAALQSGVERRARVRYASRPPLGGAWHGTPAENGDAMSWLARLRQRLSRRTGLE